MGLYKRAYIAAPQRLLQRRRNTQATAMHEKECSSSRALRLVHCGCLNAQAAMHDRLHSPPCIFKFVAAAMHELQSTIRGCRSWLGWVDFSLPPRCNISPFIPSRKLLGLNDEVLIPEVLFTRLLQFTR